jgi:hypothetical protein
MSHQIEIARQLSYQSAAMRERFSRAVPNRPARAITSLALSLLLFNAGDILVKGEGTLISSMVGLNGFSAPHLGLKDPIPQREDGGPQNWGYRVKYIFGQLRVFSPRAIRPIIINGWEAANDKIDLVEDQLQTPEGRTELGYQIWGQPNEPNFVRESAGHVLQFAGLSFALLAATTFKKEDDDEEDEEED